MRCIYCKANILKPSIEHIMQSALGCTAKSDKLICSDCNNFFSRKESGNIDTTFVKQFDLFRNFLRISGEHNSQAPTLRNVGELNGMKIDLAPGAKPTYEKSLRSPFTEENGNRVLTISSPDVKKAAEQIYHVKKQYGENVSYNACLKKDYIEEHLTIPCSFGGDAVHRAILKNLYGFIFYLQRNVHKSIGLDIEDFECLRMYLRYGQETNKVCAGIDFINHFPTQIHGDDFSNIMSITGKQNSKQVYGHIVIFGHIRYSAILKTDYTGSDFSYALIQDPINRRMKTEEQFSYPPFDGKVISEHEHSYSENINKLNAAVKSLMEHCSSKSTMDGMTDIAKELWDKYMPPEGSIIEEKHVNEFSRAMGEELGRHILRLPENKKITIE